MHHKIICTFSTINRSFKKNQNVNKILSTFYFSYKGAWGKNNNRQNVVYW